MGRRYLSFDITNPSVSNFLDALGIFLPKCFSIPNVFLTSGIKASSPLSICASYCTCTVLYCTVLYCTVLYCTVLYCTVLYCTCTVLVLYCTALCCTGESSVQMEDRSRQAIVRPGAGAGDPEEGGDGGGADTGAGGGAEGERGGDRLQESHRQGGQVRGPQQVCSVLYCTVLYCTVLHFTSKYYTKLYCTVHCVQ